MGAMNTKKREGEEGVEGEYQCKKRKRRRKPMWEEEEKEKANVGGVLEDKTTTSLEKELQGFQGIK